MILDESCWSSLEKGEITVLHQLDDDGFLIGKDEDLKGYIQRLKEWEEMKKIYFDQIKKTKKFSIEGKMFELDDTIPNEVMLEGQKINQKLYCFSIRYFASFFSKKLGLFFAGATFFPQKKFFPFFVLKNSFKKRKRFLIYDRDEITAHESCHIARASMGSYKYEEFFAYYLSKNPLRRIFGSLFKNNIETFIFLIFLCLSIGFQFLQIYAKGTRSFSLWTSLILLFVLCFFVLRQIKTYLDFKKAVKNVSPLTPYPEAILFRCSDREINKIGKTFPLDNKKLKNIIENPLRYKLIKKKLLT